MNANTPDTRSLYSASHLVRPSIHRSFHISSSPGAQQESLSSSSSTFSLQNPRKNQGESFSGSLEVGITHKELQQSIVNQLTQPSRPGTSASNKKVVGPEVSSSLSAGWFGWLVSFVALFKVYLQHVGIVLVTAVTVLLACSLRGEKKKMHDH